MSQKKSFCHHSCYYCSNADENSSWNGEFQTHSYTPKNCISWFPKILTNLWNKNLNFWDWGLNRFAWVLKLLFSKSKQINSFILDESQASRRKYILRQTLTSTWFSASGDMPGISDRESGSIINLPLKSSFWTVKMNLWLSNWIMAPHQILAPYPKNIGKDLAPIFSIDGKDASSEEEKGIHKN